jgi:hypothetical protein
MKTIFYAARVDFGRRIEISIAQQEFDGIDLFAAQPLTFTKLPEGEYADRPAMRLRTEEAQRLMDELWNAGLRPSEGTGSAGSLAATERHLKDMRDVAFGLLKGEF